MPESNFMNRRTAISVLSGGALAAVAPGTAVGQQAGQQAGQQDGQPAAPPGVMENAPPRLTPEVAAARDKPGARPLLCVYSGCLARISYAQLPEIVRNMGYDGVDLTVMKGGHVDPSLYMVDLDRAFQTFQDAGMELPMVTTSFTSPSQPFAYAILYVSAELGARFCRLGTWPPPVAGDAGGQLSQMRAMTMRNDLVQFSVTGLRCNITPLLTNHAGSYPGRNIPEVEALLSGVAPGAFGYCFDPVQAVMEAGSAAAWEPALRAALPRLAAVALSDIALNPKPQPRPMGEGVIDWKKFFATLSAARFHGPVSMYRDYETQSEVKAMMKDLAFVRARVEEAWPL
jgi:sugar phosphate isomerase/epimerase